jgi:hypothetical protein
MRMAMASVYKYNRPMCRRLRFLIAAILILAVPLQSVSATAACFCAASEHHDHDADAGSASFEACIACCTVAAVGNAVLHLPTGPVAAPRPTDLPAPASVRLDVPDPPPLAG